MNEIDHITNYLRSGENSGHRLGLELEHFVLNAWGESISFETLSRLVERIGTSLGAKLAVIDGHVMGYSVEEYSVSMEPACQLEISISPYEDIEKIKRIYDNFYILWREALLEEGYSIVVAGLDPRVEADEISPSELSIIPKKRYHFMDSYFLGTGHYGRHMMRASASTQVSIDYSSEKDLVRKLRILEKISPLLMLLMENKSDEHSFLDDINRSHLLRTQVWDDLDPDRTGFLDGSLGNGFGYEAYAKLLLSRPLVVYTFNDVTTYAGRRNLPEFLQITDSTDLEKNPEKLVEHLISMFFFHIRIKKYLEIRVADSVSIDRAIAYTALIKGLMYSEESLAALEKLLQDVTTIAEINAAVASIEEDGRDAVIYGGRNAGELADEIINISRKGLTVKERSYLGGLKNVRAFSAFG